MQIMIYKYTIYKVFFKSLVWKVLLIINLYKNNLNLYYIGHSDIVYSAKFSPDNKIIISVGADLAIKIWNATNYNLIKTI